MNLLDFLIFWFIFFVVVNGTHQGFHRAVLDAAVFFVGVILAAFVHPAFGKLLTYVFPEMWAYQIAFAAIAGGFAIAVTKPFDGVLRNDWRLSKLKPQFERVDRVSGGVIAFVLSLMFIHIFALLLLTYPVLRIDDEVRNSFLVPELYARVPKMTGFLPSNFDLAERELDSIQRGVRLQASEPPPTPTPLPAASVEPSN
jgi:uncharacterized membrane protein required for colicin V production